MFFFIFSVSSAFMTIDLNSLKLSPEDAAAGGKKERMISLRDSQVQKKHVLTRMVGTADSPGLYPANLKESIQGAGAIEAMSDSSKSMILQVLGKVHILEVKKHH